MRLQNVIRGLAVALAGAAVLPAAWAARLTLQHGLNGYAGARDTWLNEASKHNNYGGDSKLVVRYDSLDGGYVEDCALVRFDLPEVPHDTLTSATLEMFYIYAGSMQKNNAMGIKPYRVHPSKNWFENTRNGTPGEGASWRYFGQVETEANKWTYESGGWYDKVDDGNSSNVVKGLGGSVSGAIEPNNWVAFEVRGSVTQWLAGTQNNGFILFSCHFQGSGYEVYAHFASRETNNAAIRPRLRLHYLGAQITWTGRVSGAWDTSSTNWSVGGWPGLYDNGDDVRFTDATAQTNVIVASGLSPGSVTISNNAKAYQFSGGSLGGKGLVLKMGTGTVTLAASNSYTGPTIIAGGTLVVLSNAALGLTAAGTTVSSGAVLRLQGSVSYTAPEPLSLAGTLEGFLGTNQWAGPVTVAGPVTLRAVPASRLVLEQGLSGAQGAVTVTGGGTVELRGAGTYNGGTVVTNGALWVCNADGSATGPGAVEIRAGGTLGGSGCVGGPVTVMSNGVVNPGDSVGTLSVSNRLSLEDGSRLVVEVDLSGPDVLDLRRGGALHLAPLATLEVGDALLGTNAHVLVRGAMQVEGHFAGLPSGTTLPPPNTNWYIHYKPSGIYLGRNAHPVWYFRGVAHEGQALLCWRTPVELDVLGYDLYRYESGMWVKVNDDPLPSQHPNGAAYGFVDPAMGPGMAGRYRLVELFANGASNELVDCVREFTELAFTAAPKEKEDGVELRWRSREDETYELEWAENPLEDYQPCTGPLPATPGENIYTNLVSTPAGSYRVVLLP